MTFTIKIRIDRQLDLSCSVFVIIDYPTGAPLLVHSSCEELFPDIVTTKSQFLKLSLFQNLQANLCH